MISMPDTNPSVTTTPAAGDTAAQEPRVIPKERFDEVNNARKLAEEAVTARDALLASKNAELELANAKLADVQLTSKEREMAALALEEGSKFGFKPEQIKGFKLDTSNPEVLKSQLSEYAKLFPTQETNTQSPMVDSNKSRAAIPASSDETLKQIATLPMDQQKAELRRLGLLN